ncbi:leucine-richprotein [Angomonas deanei]|uniref:Leucine-rich repeat and WD repeat-containing protein 1 LRR domain-containing protein n=1 Tax=Angomonas deanei TaxID=59799 RepID=A0A7G2CV10_9TRYP|nr:leucine-richprotein [Angomonas deanei]CAD2222911.1 hypothetical protein, conserved [Angomonas deanei]|eukprot:EPY43701.1 leucine-richprotein [Angomonas deanei]
MNYQTNMKTIPEIIRLTKHYLEELYLDNNYNLEETGEHLGHLTKLTVVDLRYDRLYHLHPSVGKLVALQTLLLSNNQLFYLPVELRHLKQLRTLRLDSNRLSILPSCLLFLPHLHELELENNPLYTEEFLKNKTSQFVLGDLRKKYKEHHPDSSEELWSAVDCDSCCLRTTRHTCMVRFHPILQYTKVPFLHFVCSEECKRNLRAKLNEYDEQHHK